MVSAYALFTHPFPTSSSDSLFSYPPPPPPPPTAHFLRHHHHDFSSSSPLLKLSKTQKPDPNPSPTRPEHHSLLNCSPNPVSANICTILSLLQAVGINEKEANALLDKNPVLGLSSLHSLRARIDLFNSVGLDGIVLSNLILKCPHLLTASEIEPFLRFMFDDMEAKIEPGRLRKLFRGADVCFLAGFKDKVSLLVRCGVPKDKILGVLNKVNLYKALCLKSVEEIDMSIMFLNKFGGIDLIVRRPSLLNYDLETQLVPRIEFLMEVSGGDEAAMGVLVGKLPAILSYIVCFYRITQDVI